MDKYIITYLQDVLDAINELESFFIDYPMRYDVFEKDFLRRSAVERKVEIMGEAINRILKIDPQFQLRDAKEIVRTRNRVIHGYDSVTPDFLWLLIIRYIPILKQDVTELLSQV
jgi:uncharacterized protein with HEPN domain